MDSRLTSPLQCTTLCRAMVIAMALTGCLGASGATPRPSLVVGVVVEGLDADCIELLRDCFGSDGFNRLRAQGIEITDMMFGPEMDATAATTMLMTGTSPAVNGVGAALTYDPATGRTQHIFHSPKTLGNFTSSTLSPEALGVTTIADEVVLDSDGTGRVHVIAPDSPQAIALAGHAANSSFWIDGNTGKWASSTHYKEVPSAVSNRNYRNPLTARLDTMTWSPSLSLDRYPDLPPHKRKYPFRITFDKKSCPDPVAAFMASPKANTEVTDIALEYISSATTGKRGVTDMLNIAYTVEPFPFGRYGDMRLASMDAYVKLDAELARLMKAIDRSPGMNSTLLFVAGVPAPSGRRRDDEKWTMPGGTFSPRKAMSLLNMYLMAIHGNGEWVSGYHNRRVYLNRELAKQRQVDMNALRRESAEFLTRVSGISGAVTADEIYTSAKGETAPSLRDNIVPRDPFDMIITVAPGWEIETSSGTQRHITESAATGAYPLFIMAPGRQPRKIDIPVDARRVAPTITRLLRIRSPNGASMPPLRID